MLVEFGKNFIESFAFILDTISHDHDINAFCGLTQCDERHYGRKRSVLEILKAKASEFRILTAGVRMPVQNDDLKDRLSRYSEITITVTGRKSGRTISRPIWFVWDDNKLYLLPVQGSDTQWYKNVLKNPTIRIDARGAEAEAQAIPITDANQVKSVIERFREKYGAGDVKKYYSKFDVAVLARMQ